jgi:NAD-binding of NADP-dependent 3-hydroxyisobutyrate dehydrogenase/NAD binding domain of 6-phosphogluconate dehydrogenase
MSRLLCLTELLRRMAESPHSLTGAPALRVIGLAGWPRVGPPALAARAALGLTVIETSTLAPEDKRRNGSSWPATWRGCWTARVSGTGTQARDKDLVAYLSGDEAAKARALPVLAAMTREIYDVGDFGNGTKLKLVANLLVAVHNVAGAEALVLAERAGLDLATVLAAVGDGAGTWRMFEVRGPAMAAQDYAGPGGSGQRVRQRHLDHHRVRQPVAQPYSPVQPGLRVLPGGAGPGARGG